MNQQKMTCSTAIIIFIGLALCSNAYGQETSPGPETALMDKVSDIMNTPGLNETALQHVENAKDKIKKKCEQNGGSFEKLTTATTDLESCLRGLLDVNVLQEEIEKAKPHGELDSVFQKYCMKNVTLLKCMDDFISVLDPCLETVERENLRTLPNVTKSFLNFICHKEGDRIALFIAAGGPECFQSQQSAIQDCFNRTFGSSLPSVAGTMPDFESFPSLVFNAEQCNNMAKVQECIVKELEKCSDPTPANMGDALLTFIKNATPCHEILQGRANAVIGGDYDDSEDRSAASSLMSAYSIVLVPTAVMLKYV